MPAPHVADSDDTDAYHATHFSCSNTDANELRLSVRFFRADSSPTTSHSRTSQKIPVADGLIFTDHEQRGGNGVRGCGGTGNKHGGEPLLLHRFVWCAGPNVRGPCMVRGNAHRVAVP
jgi:hypothetical protein